MASVSETPRKRRRSQEPDKAEQVAILSAPDLEPDRAHNKRDASDHEDPSDPVSKPDDEPIFPPSPRRCQTSDSALPANTAHATPMMAAQSVTLSCGKEKWPQKSRDRLDNNTLNVSILYPPMPPPRLQDARADLANTG
jgi:hypothetical protein